MYTSKFKQFLLLTMVLFLVVNLLTFGGSNQTATAQVSGLDVLYTTDEDFDLGTLVSVNHDAPFNDQLQLDSPIEPFPFINVAASGRGTVVRANTETGEVVGEYRTAPEGRGLDPSRTTVDLFGNVWTANRGEVGFIDGVRHGSAVKIGLILGGTRVDETGSVDPDGGYLAPPFGYNTCVDRDVDGLIRTSKGLGDLLGWPDDTDGAGGADGLVQDAEDECILIYQRLYDAEQARHVSVDADNNVWVGGYPFQLRMFYKLDGVTGAILDSFDSREIGCGGYGGLIDGNGILWSVGGPLLRYDPVSRSGFCIEEYGYGLGVDTNGYIWMSLWDGGIVKIAPDGTVVPGFPKPTYPSSLTSSSLPAFNQEPLMAASVPVRMEAPQAPLMAVSAPMRMEAPLSPLTNGDPVTFQVAPVDDWVQSSSPWTPGATISLTIEDGSSVVYSDSQMADTDGNFNFELWDRFDLQRGHVVTVSDGTTTKTHTVANLFVDGVDVEADTVFGRADAGTDVDVWVHGDGNLTITADSAGNWTADFFSMTDLTYLSDGGSQQTDSDGDSTSVWWASPRFQVSPDDDWVGSSTQWTPGATISLTIEDGSGVVYADSQTADIHGYFNFNLWDVFDLQRGHVVTVSDGLTTKTHAVSNLFIDGVEVDEDDVYGRADAGTSVEVWVDGNGTLTVTADGSGDWTADFSGMTDLTFSSKCGSQQYDDDADSTGVWWVSPRFQVAPDDEWVGSSTRWTPGATISLTIEDGSGVVYSDSQVTDSHGNFYFNLWDVFDLQRGHVVTVSDGTTTKTHTVINLFVDGVDVTAETVFGHTDAGADVDVWVHGDGNLTVTPDGAGNWEADFSGMTDLTYLSDGGSQQADDDGDSTGVWWSIPRLQVRPDNDWVGSWNRWTPGATISLTIEDGSGVVYSDSQVTNCHGNFYFNLWDMFDLERGQVVTVSDGTTTKTHTVANLFVDGIDVTADTVSGRADAGATVDVWVHGDGGLTVTADGAGNWTADFSGMTDLTFLSDGGSQQADSDGDSTGVWWASPKFKVMPADDIVDSVSSWTPAATISLSIEDGSGVVYTDSRVADYHGNFEFDLWDVFDLQRGHMVTVSDGTTTKIHTVTNLFVDSVDVTADTVFGRADTGTSVDIWVHEDGSQIVTADGSGNWVADFSGMTDLTYLSDGGSMQVDDDGDGTGVWWASPRFELAPEDDWVQSSGTWPAGVTILLTIEDGGGVVYTDSQEADHRGYFNFNLWEVFDLQRGHVVTVTDGTTTKTHTVANLYVDGVDITADTVFGRADAGTDVDVWVHGNGGVTVTADGAGNWTADFSGMTDLTYLSDGVSDQVDDDGDATGVWWYSPRFQVEPEDDWVQSWSTWTPYATISLTIEDSGGVLYSDTQTSDARGHFNFNLWDAFDLQRGHLVTVSDGTTTKTHTVASLFVDGFDETANTVFGRAAPGTDVEVWVHDDGNLTVAADGSGNWTADFSGLTDLTYQTNGGSQQTDPDGDSTSVWWAKPQFQVSPDDNWVGSWNRWIPGSIISLTIEDGAGVVYSDSQTADTHGEFSFNVWPIDIVTGHLVTVSDVTTTRSHTVTALTVTNIDTAAERIHGTANPDAQVGVWVNLFDEGSHRRVTADSAGNWMADFSVAADGEPAFDITEITRITAREFDDDGDSTNRGFGPPVQQNRGVAVTPIDNHVWVANSGVATVTRLDNDGNVIKVIETGDQPTGVAVDATGKVWATNMGDSNTVRIDPNAGSDGLGAVDLTVDLGEDAWPYNYSDMTGAVVVGSTSPQGLWTVVQDSQSPGFQWGRITWNNEPEGSEPPGTAIVVEARAADSEAGLGGQAFQPVVDGDLFSMFGRFIEVRVTLKASPEGASPVLSDIRVQPHVIYVDIDIKPGSFPNSINCDNQKETIAVAVLTTADFDALTIDHKSVTFEGASETHVNKKTGEPRRHETDVDDDGDLDLVFHFRLGDTALTCMSTTGTLIGEIYAGIPIEGDDSVRMVTKENCVLPPSGMVSWWPGDGNAEDIAGNNDGMVEGDATFAPGIVGQAFAFDGDGDYVKVPRSLDLDVGDQLTIELWMKADPSNLMEECCQGLVTTDFYEFAVAPGGGSVTGVMLMVAADYWVHSSDLGDGGYSLAPGEWYHVAGVYDGSNIKFYVNGQLVVAPPPQTGSIRPMLETSFLAIGSEDGRTNEPDLIGQRYFHGLIDEVELYNRSLSESEIQAIYNAGSAGKCKGP